MQKFAVQEIRKIAKIVLWDEQEKYIKMLIPVQT